MNAASHCHRATVPRGFLLMVVIAVLLLIAGCAPGDDARSVNDDSPLTLAYLPSEEDPEGRMSAFAELGEYLSDALDRPVRIVQANGYGPTIEAMRAGKVDIIRANGPFTYVIANEKAGAEAIVRVGSSAGPGLYQSMIVAHPETGIETLEDLIARAGELDFAFVDPASASGHLIPRALFESRGIDPEEDFARTIFTMTHANSAMAVISGKVHAGAISSATYELFLKTGVMAADAMTVLWRSDPIPTGPVMVRSDLPQELKDRLRDAYLALNSGETELYRAMTQVYNTEDLRFYPAADADWDPLRRIARNITSMQLLPESEPQ